MPLSHDAIRVRAVLTKEGESDIRLELHRNTNVEFVVIENGKPAGAYYLTLTPSTTGAPGLVYAETSLSISDAFEGCLAKQYPGYTATNVEFD